MFRSALPFRTRRGRIGGFSMVELAVSMTVLLILTAIAIPSLMRSFRTYQLNDAAGRFSDMLKFTRFEAVRRNTQLCFLMQQNGPGAGWTLGTSSRGAIRVGGAVSSFVFVFYFGSAADPEFGYRAVILLPSGATQMWTGPQGGPWQRFA